MKSWSHVKLRGITFKNVNEKFENIVHKKISPWSPLLISKLFAGVTGVNSVVTPAPDSDSTMTTLKQKHVTW